MDDTHLKTWDLRGGKLAFKKDASADAWLFVTCAACRRSRVRFTIINAVMYAGYVHFEQ